MNNNFHKKKCFNLYKETKDIGFVLLVFGAVTVCAFFLPPNSPPWPCSYNMRPYSSEKVILIFPVILFFLKTLQPSFQFPVF